MNFITTLTLLGQDSIAHKLAGSVLEFVWALRYTSYSKPQKILIHKQEEESKGYFYFFSHVKTRRVIAVRRSVLSAMTRAFLALPPWLLIQEYTFMLDDYFKWLTDVVKNDPDTECRQLAGVAVSVLGEKLQNQTKVF